MSDGPHLSDSVAGTTSRGLDRVVASAPGKLILMGEHSAVYGRPALVAAIDHRTTVTVERRPQGVELDLVSLDHRETTEWRDVLAYANVKRSEWREFARDPSAGFGDGDGEDPARLVRVALGETARELGVEAPPPVRVEVRSEIPVGAGFGSSASVAVAIAASLFELMGEPAEPARVAKVALEVERRQHGNPSGVDHTTVLRGGLLRLEPAGSAISDVPGGLKASSLRPAPERIAELGVFHTGAPAESTGEVVAAVREKRDRDPAGFETVLDRMESETQRFEAGLAVPAGPDTAIAAMRAFEACLEELGVVPDDLAGVIREVEKAGGAAKISGAGALSPGGAGALLVCRPQGNDLSPSLEVFAAYTSPNRPLIGAPGLEIEERS